ncbi:MAG: hypothetical protein EP346_11325 [Bacteroidetes bacterium]|uniref:Polysaccharide chain length determinant N-terminal domain-containing protein n=1 Tax=Phaeocystidibacter marisrubri TaxID=1577780 RepID=A0A6L3ZDN3_9FLAO|nr:hypothetical protein [Phaeocystidibacter marisrubri]KAB2815973.1 hypothetical protein F8C82_09760 [Phaeocystidibacter marisrubri]TNE27814.1 MAG: hypothetical protein EP346_11325 [Bacteroidota bacterium]GGH66672.1 hypothetical protein GCM10011318_04880 [Phaeocystidibacter marisrubri]
MDYQSTNLIAFLYKWRKPLLILPLVAGVIAAILSAPTFIAPKYQSSVILYPSTTNSVSKALLPQTGYADEDILEFGAEEEAEQLLQILNSDEIRDSIVEMYNLMEHYEIDQESPYKMTELRETFSDNVDFRRTEYMSVEISVLDEDPQTAADIANDISGLLDRVKRRIQRERSRIGLSIVQNAYDQIKGEAKSLENGLKDLRLRGVHDYESQAAVYSEQLAIAIVERGPNDSRVKELKNQMDTLAKYGGRYVDMRDELELLKEEEIKVKTKLDQAKVDYHQNLPSTFKVNSATPAEKKTYPIRSLIVLISMIGTFVATMIVILSITAYKDVRKAQS